MSTHESTTSPTAFQASGLTSPSPVHARYLGDPVAPPRSACTMPSTGGPAAGAAAATAIESML
eukprot:CAMPEP_0117616456 /NCGR_PEP_ID=MMETSP0784-20121206/85070_1 /TAXON_ID=39447 /ORGANISM="" /LENGTH=62 /DNA_ID=CAMNT_0005420235 /DNA_START=242 /DNA_END=430 /DNA_ORIENTATION=-